MLAGGFDRVNGSQRTRWYAKRLNRVLYGALKAMLVNICIGTKIEPINMTYRNISDTAKAYLTQPYR